MTVNEFVRRIQAKVSMLSTGDIPIKLNGKDIECVIELIENGKGYYINIKQPTKDLALTWEDMKALDHITNEVEYLNIQAEYVGKEPPYSDDEAFYGEILRRFNEQREKK